MSEPTVVCVMLTADRPALAKRAVECFRAQTYPRKRLLIWDTGDGPSEYPEYENCVLYFNASQPTTRSIGTLRNDANSFAVIGASPAAIDIFIHWDDDDWSHPNRIAEQVELMESTGADVAGYIKMLFWRSPEIVSPEQSKSDLALTVDRGTGEAWHWTGSTILGTSLCYRRAVWERFPFPDTSYGEDTDWLKRVQHAKLRVAAETSLVVSDEFTGTADDGIAVPRMIARIHAANTSKAYAPKAMQDAPHHWSRAPEWDDFCRKVME